MLASSLQHSSFPLGLVPRSRCRVEAPTPKSAAQVEATALAAKRRRARMMVAALCGAATGFGCQLLPETWRMPCIALVKLVALLVGGTA